MRTSQFSWQNGCQSTPPRTARMFRSSHGRPGIYSKTLMLLLTAFVICAFVQTIQLNYLLADAASVSKSVAELCSERELISTKYASYFRVIEKYGLT